MFSVISVGWAVLLICLLAGGTLFFSVNNIALRIFSRAKLLEALKEVNTEQAAENLQKMLKGWF